MRPYPVAVKEEEADSGGDDPEQPCGEREPGGQLELLAVGGGACVGYVTVRNFCISI